MFRQIQRVEIELQNTCNRKCEWCPNKDLIRECYEEMPEDVFLRIIQELKDENLPIKKHRHHNKHISFNRFCEPMYNIELLKKRVNQAIDILPDVLYVVNTNGDFITKENLSGLHIDKLNIMDYDSKGYDYWMKKLDEVGVVIAHSNPESQFIIGFHKNIAKVLVAVNWTENALLEDRAGYLTEDITYNGNTLKWKEDKQKRAIPCVEPTHAISIDWNGNVVPCCHYRSDNPDHQDLIFGNIYNNTLKEVFYSDKAEAFRDQFMDTIDKYPDGCKNCQKIRYGHFPNFSKYNPAYGWKGNKWEDIWNFMDI